jgi:hypothetical protein
MLVQPATVARWHRRGFQGWWRARSRRRPGRPRIESDVRDLIRRMSTENRLWGAPRLDGELMKLGIAVSERTVSRYLPDRTRGRSQTWRTFLTNHVGDLMCSSAVASSERPGDDDVVDTGLFSFCVTPTPGTGTPPTTRRLPMALIRFNARPFARGIPWPDPLHRARTIQFRPRSAKSLRARLATRIRAEISFVRRCRFVQAARTISDDPFAMRLGSLSGNSETLRVRPAPLIWRQG